MNKMLDQVKDAKENNEVIKVTKKFSKKLSLERFQEIWAELKEKFPLLFAQEKIRIMKKRIHLDLVERTEISKEEIRSFLNQYCNMKKYLKAHKAGNMRYDLDGNEIEEVTVQEVEDKLQYLKALEEQRKKWKEDKIKAQENSVNVIESS